ncbi:hypothetical protein ACFY1P_16080 [Streptomyces sp. NPDC001407]|uniref:hypothetical protein n=1 Tax=Streptomyces sp. NPDC001407 TaxID=3364573 RepID=UPI0036A5B3D0
MLRSKKALRASLALAVASIALAVPSQAATGQAANAQGKPGASEEYNLSIYNRTHDNIGTYPCVAHEWNFPNWPIASIASNCNRRVWLHRNIDKSDSPMCVPPADQAWVTDIPEAFQHPAILEVGKAAWC